MSDSPAPANARIAIVGGGVASWRAASELRRCGHHGPLTVVGGETPYPYDRPPLSKQFLTADVGPESIGLIGPEDLLALDARYHHARVAVSVDASCQTLALDDGSVVDFDALVIATGTTSVHLDLPGAGLPGVHSLRSLAHAIEVRRALARLPRVAIVGGGFIGCEVAASCRALGLTVTLIEAEPELLTRQMGARFGRFVSSLHRDAGVEVLCGTAVQGIVGAARAEGIHLADGRHVEADLVLIGVGSVPQDGWLAGSGIKTDDGVLIDQHGWTGVDHIYAAGDVARWQSELLNDSVRVEHWTSAVEQGRMVARNLMDRAGTVATINQVPYFWTDQYAMTAQLVGFATGEEHELRVSDGELGVAYAHDGRLAGVLAVNWPRLALAARRCVGRPTALGAAIDTLLAAA